MNQEKLAEVISKILSPVSIAFYVITIITFFSPIKQSYQNTFISFILALFFLVFFPMMFILYYFKRGKIDLWVSDRKIRTPFYIIAIIGYIISISIFYQIKNYDMLILSLAYFFVTTVVMLTNLITKVSSHSAGVAGPLTAITFMFGYFSSVSFILVIIVIWARLKMKAHNLLQLVSGVVISIIITFLVYYFSYNYFT